MPNGHLVIPGTDGPNDLSDIKVTTPEYSEVTPLQLPIRGEKRVVPSFVDIQGGMGGNAQIQSKLLTNPNQVNFEDFVTSAALTPFVDFIFIRIPHRGFTSQGKLDTNGSATFRFLINPATVQINRTTVDQQTLTRGGWQFGVWGEDVLSISLQGTTAGQYFAYGLTDQFHQFTESYRNLQQLLMVFENNGYFFEGEAAGQGPLAADFTRRRIKMHQDVELTVGNYIWSGMFDTMTITKSADHPFNYSFTLQFVAWKERFRSGSPYYQTVLNDSQLGHSYDSYFPAVQRANVTQQQQQVGQPSIPLAPPPSITPFPPNGGPLAPSVASSQQEDFAQNLDPTAVDLGYNSATAFFSLFPPGPKTAVPLRAPQNGGLNS